MKNKINEYYKKIIIETTLDDALNDAFVDLDENEFLNKLNEDLSSVFDNSDHPECFETMRDQDLLELFLNCHPEYDNSLFNLDYILNVIKKKFNRG